MTVAEPYNILKGMAAYGDDEVNCEAVGSIGGGSAPALQIGGGAEAGNDGIGGGATFQEAPPAIGGGVNVENLVPGIGGGVQIDGPPGIGGGAF
ncbi:unnamed protein product, partial [Mesorhabditis spiculigera]